MRITAILPFEGTDACFEMAELTGVCRVLWLSNASRPEMALAFETQELASSSFLIDISGVASNTDPAKMLV